MDGSWKHQLPQVHHGQRRLDVWCLRLGDTNVGHQTFSGNKNDIIVIVIDREYALGVLVITLMNGDYLIRNRHILWNCRNWWLLKASTFAGSPWPATFLDIQCLHLGDTNVGHQTFPGNKIFIFDCKAVSVSLTLALKNNDCSVVISRFFSSNCACAGNWFARNFFRQIIKCRLDVRCLRFWEILMLDIKPFQVIKVPLLHNT